MEQATAALRRQPAPDPSAWLSDYHPRGLDPSLWTVSRSFVLACARELGLQPTASGHRLLRVLGRLAGWCVAQGIRLEPDLVLDPETIERFVASLPAGPSRATYRSDLRRIGPLLTSSAPWEPRAPSLARRQVAAPYTDTEVACLTQAARRQPTPSRVRAARALLALGLGAGLDGRWLAKVAADDVAATAWGVLVRVGEPVPRVVPVLAAWEDEVLDLADAAGDQFLIGGHSTSSHRVSHVTASLVVGHGQPAFSASRLRSTWLLTHLRQGTRLPELAQAAGLSGVTVLSDLLEHVEPLEDGETVELLRGRP